MRFEYVIAFFLLCLMVSSIPASGQGAEVQEANQDLRNRDFPEAIAAYTRALAIDPANAKLLCARAIAYSFSGDQEHAIQDCTQAISLEPDNVTDYMVRSGFYCSLHQVDSALNDLNKAIELDPKTEKAYVLRGAIYADMGKFDFSIQDDSTALSLADSDFSVFLTRGCDYQEMGENEKAISDLSQFLLHSSPQQNSSSLATFHALEVRAECYSKLQQFDLALADANSVLEVDPNNIGGLLVRAAVYAEKADYDHALLDLSQVSKMNPQNDKAFSIAGDIRFKQGRGVQAVKDYNKALELNPNNIYTNNSLAWLLATSPDDSLRDGKRAVTLSQKACELNQQKADPAMLDTLGASYAEAGDFPDAVKAESDAIKELPIANPKFEARLALYQQNQPYRDSAQARSEP